jgi:hypothetical protein
MTPGHAACLPCRKSVTEQPEWAHEVFLAFARALRTPKTGLRHKGQVWVDKCLNRLLTDILYHGDVYFV